MVWFFVCFLLSGCCGLIYQVVWLRVAMTDFGVTTPLVSIVLSVFMAGLAAGSWGGGRLTRRLDKLGPRGFLVLYGATELLIGLSGLVVVPLLGVGRGLLITSAAPANWDSATYYLASAACVTAVLLPFCICMGATFPLVMAAIRGARPDASDRSFSFLYVANVLGAMAGALGSAFILIELFGFRATLLVAAALNAVVATIAFVASRRIVATPAPAFAGRGAATPEPPRPAVAAPRPSSLGLAFLFTTGMVSLALEVVWTRQFVPFMGPVAYTFAMMLAVYLAATAIGSRAYRYLRAHKPDMDLLFPWLVAALLAGTCALFPLLAADPRLRAPYGLLFGSMRIIVGIAPFCAVLGFFTPMLVDRISGGDADRAGTAYALNTLGGIVGPLLSGFVLLPLVGEKWTTLLLVTPIFAFAPAGVRHPVWPVLPEVLRRNRRSMIAAFAAVVLFLVVAPRNFETRYRDRVVLRDYTATVLATGEGQSKQLLVNGHGMTSLTPITKLMAHLPLAMLDRNAKRGLVLCLGMGTSYRSMLSWGIDSTVVELVPSVPKLLPFYHPNGEEMLHSPNSRIVVDDARRFLDRSPDNYDVIVIDPPPPVEAAGSGLLYTVEFYDTVRRRLAPGGILQQWLPEAEPVVVSAFAKAIGSRFRHVRVFRSVEGWGLHFLASDMPIADHTASELAARLPERAARDIVEWGPYATPEQQFQAVVGKELSLQQVIATDGSAPIMSDDHPVNEYYFVRRLLHPPKNLHIYR